MNLRALLLGPPPYRLGPLPYRLGPPPYGLARVCPQLAPLAMAHLHHQSDGEAGHICALMLVGGDQMGALVAPQLQLFPLL